MHEHADHDKSGISDNQDKPPRNSLYQAPDKTDIAKSGPVRPSERLNPLSGTHVPLARVLASSINTYSLL